MSKFGQKLDNYFEISARNSTIKTEIMGGLTTFFAMCYIMLVNPSQMVGFKHFEGVPGAQAVWNSVFIATAIGAIIGTLLMAFYAKMPFAQASGMGLNSFFFTSFMINGFGNCVTMYLPGVTTPEGNPVLNPEFDFAAAYSVGLTIIFISGIIFMLLSVTGLRKKIAEALPDSLKKAIPAGIGLFIAFIGLQGAGIIQSNPYTLVQLVDLNVYGGQVTWFFNPITKLGISAPIAALFGFLLIAALSKTKLGKYNVIIGIIFTTCLYYLFNIGNAPVFDINMTNPGDAFVDFGKLGVQGWFKGFSHWTGAAVLQGILLVITFCLIDMFDTLGTLQGAATEAGMLDEDGNPHNLDKCLMADSTATVVGAMVGTSTVTTFVESSAGVSAGARTGLSSFVVAMLFFITMFLSPIAAVIPPCATAPALIYVGVLMVKNFKNVDFSDLTNAVPAFLTLIMMPLTYSISNGIAMGMISYMILKFFNVFFVKQEVPATEEGAEPTKKLMIKEYFAIGKGKTGDFFSKDIIILVVAALFMIRFFMVSF